MAWWHKEETAQVRSIATVDATFWSCLYGYDSMTIDVDWVKMKTCKTYFIGCMLGADGAQVSALVPQVDESKSVAWETTLLYINKKSMNR